MGKGRTGGEREGVGVWKKYEDLREDTAKIELKKVVENVRK